MLLRTTPLPLVAGPHCSPRQSLKQFTVGSLKPSKGFKNLLPPRPRAARCRCSLFTAALVMLQPPPPLPLVAGPHCSPRQSLKQFTVGSLKPSKGFKNLLPFLPPCR